MNVKIMMIDRQLGIFELVVTISRKIYFTNFIDFHSNIRLNWFSINFQVSADLTSKKLRKRLIEDPDL